MRQTQLIVSKSILTVPSHTPSHVHTGKVYQKDLTHDCPQESSEIDLLGLFFGPTLKISDQRCASTSPR